MENLVLADRRCNNDKRDLLPGPAHVTAWVTVTSATMLHSPSYPPLPGGTPIRAAAIAAARPIYGHLPPDSALLWLGHKDVAPADPAIAVAALIQ